MPWATDSNAGRTVLPGELLPQTQFTMSYIDDLLFSKELHYLDDICRSARVLSFRPGIFLWRSWLA